MGAGRAGARRGCSSAHAPPATIPAVLRPDQLGSPLRERPDVRLLDVRTPGEYETAHVRGAYNVPLDTLGEHGPEIRAHVDQPVVLICQSGQRARGFEQVINPDGGYAGWRASGRPMERAGGRVARAA